MAAKIPGRVDQLVTVFENPTAPTQGKQAPEKPSESLLEQIQDTVELVEDSGQNAWDRLETRIGSLWSDASRVIDSSRGARVDSDLDMPALALHPQTVFENILVDINTKGKVAHDFLEGATQLIASNTTFIEMGPAEIEAETLDGSGALMMDMMAHMLNKGSDDDTIA